MKNLKNLAAFVATAALATAAMAQNIDNWRNASGDVWKNSSGDCWRDSSWTPATAAPECGAPVAAPKAAAPVAEDVAEPVKRESAKAEKPTPTAKKGLDDVVKAWSDEE